MLTQNIVGNLISISTFCRILVKFCRRCYVECHIPFHQIKRLYSYLTTVNDYIVLNIGITYYWTVRSAALTCENTLEPAGLGILLTSFEIPLLKDMYCQLYLK